MSIELQQALIESGFVSPQKPRPLTAEQVKAQFIEHGMTVTAWANSRGYRPHAVYQVLNGLTKCNRGNAHQIAIDLGMKFANEQSAD